MGAYLIRRIVFSVLGVVIWFCAFQIHDFLVKMSRPTPAAIGAAPFPVSQFTPMEQKQSTVEEGDAEGGTSWVYNWNFSSSADPKQVADYYDVVYPHTRHQGSDDDESGELGYAFDVTPAGAGDGDHIHIMVTSPKLEYQLLSEEFAELGARVPMPEPDAAQAATKINIVETTRARGFMPSVRAIRYSLIGLLLLTYLGVRFGPKLMNREPALQTVDAPVAAPPPPPPPAPVVAEAPPPAVPAGLTEAEFQQEVIAAIKAAFPNAEVKIKDTLTLLVPQRQGMDDVELTTLYFMCKNNPNGRAAMIERYVKNLPIIAG